MFNKEQSPQEKKFRVPAPRAKAVELLGGRVSEEEKEITLSDGQKRFIHLVEKGGGLLKIIDKKEWAGVLNHSLLVYRVAGFLAQELKKRGIDIDVKRVSEGALLHDVAKRAEDENAWYGLSDKNTEHAKLGAKWLRENDLPAPGMERYIRLLVKKGLEERGIKFFKSLYKED